MEQLNDGDPKSIGPYRVIGVLGSGGMGKVYLCTSPGGRRLAVKVIRPELADDAHFRARFRREVATAQLVRSHVTAAVVDADTESPTPWLATIFLDGPTLSAAVEQSPLGENELRRLAAALAEALQFIHGAGLVHRDLKPSNIILAPDGPRVIDFGIARAADATALTTTNLRIGSPGYMAPEQIRTDATGPESDIFALGAVLAYAATGRSPFGAGATDVVLYRVLHEEPNLDDVPPSMRSLVAECLIKDPERRPTPEVILQRTTGEPVTLFLTQTLLGETALPDASDALTSPVGVAATRVGTQGVGKVV
jgi:eukaryotic-like serine/threonine-protein kinase